MDTSTSSGNTDYEWAVGLNRACLSLLGIWPETYKTARRKLIMNIRIITVLILIICSCTIPIIHSLIRIWGDITSMINNLQFTLPILLAKMKLLTMWQKRTILISLLKMIQEDWIKIKTEEEKTVMIKRAQTTRLIIICEYIGMIFPLILFIILPSFGISLRSSNSNNTDRMNLMPLQAYYMYNVSRSPFFEVTFILQSFSFIAIGASYTGTDTFMGLLIFHVCGQLENLKARILHLNNLKNLENILSTVKDHIRLIRFIKTVDSTFTLLLFEILATFGTLFALYGFLFVTIMTQNHNLPVGQLILNLSAFLSAFMHMFLYCIVGEFLVTHCDGIHEAICQSVWYNFKPKQTKNILIILMQTNRPLYLTAGNLFPMTMVTLCNLIKTSGGYVSVLLAYRK